jgi:hypothetical protein
MEGERADMVRAGEEGEKVEKREIVNEGEMVKAKEAAEKKAGRESRGEPGAARHGNFINYYEFHPVEERLRLLPPDLASRVAPREGPTLVLDAGCNAGVSLSSHPLLTELT